jgi:hypothetical protein
MCLADLLLFPARIVYGIENTVLGAETLAKARPGTSIPAFNG